MDTIGSRIKARREELGLSQEYVAKALGYRSRSSINKIELNQRNLTQSKIKAFADILQTSPSHLMGWDDAMFAKQETYEGKMTEMYERQPHVMIQRDPELQDVLEMYRTRPECRMLFSLAKGATAEDVKRAAAIIEALRATEEH